MPPNGLANRPRSQDNNDNAEGLLAPEPEIVIETTPEHRNLVAGDPECEGWTRSPDDPGVVRRREELREHNGIPELETVTPAHHDRAVELFYRDGFVVVTDALDHTVLSNLRTGTDRVVDDILAVDPEAAAGGGAGGLPHRYSFGSSSASRHRLHEPEWVALVDIPAVTGILTAIFGADTYVLGGAGGDLALPGAIEYQGLHADRIWSEPFDPVGGLTTPELPVPVVTINFTVTDLTWENGPIRQIPGSQRWLDPIPSLTDEPTWMRYSTLCPVPAGSAVFRDNRAWHGGTPNLSNDVRAFPNLEFYAPWFRSEGIHRSMPYDLWSQLSDHGKRVSRYVVCGPNEVVVGAGFTHPRQAERDAFVAQQLAELGPPYEHDWFLRR
ncbi:MAG: phytanoyl-CoA dioxygenase family protein [Acidimicrobiales bacterium]